MTPPPGPQGFDPLMTVGRGGPGRFPVVSAICSLALAAAVVVQIVFIAREWGTGVVVNYFAVTSTIAAVVTAAALFVRSADWKAMVMGGGIGAWLVILFVPAFLYPYDVGSVMGWLILVLIVATVLAGDYDARLPSGQRLFIRLLIGGAVSGAIVLSLGVAALVVSIASLAGNF